MGTLKSVHSTWHPVAPLKGSPDTVGCCSPWLRTSGRESGSYSPSGASLHCPMADFSGSGRGTLPEQEGRRPNWRGPAEVSPSRWATKGTPHLHLPPEAATSPSRAGGRGLHIPASPLGAGAGRAGKVPGSHQLLPFAGPGAGAAAARCLAGGGDPRAAAFARRVLHTSGGWAVRASAPAPAPRPLQPAAPRERGALPPPGPATAPGRASPQSGAAQRGTSPASSEGEAPGLRAFLW